MGSLSFWSVIEMLGSLGARLEGLRVLAGGLLPTRRGAETRAGGSALRIRVDDLSGPEVAALLRQHLESVARLSPPESVHALDLEGLRAPEVTFWSAWQGSVLVGCAALKELDAQHGEIKSMCTATAHRRRGVATALLARLLDVAGGRGYRRLSLETGAHTAFAPARALYARFGFEPCGPFADYVDDPNSVFMTRALEPGSRPS